MDVTEPAGHLAEDEAGIDAGIDLTPRDVTPRRRRGRRATWGIIVGVAVLALVGIVLWNGLTQATVFFYNVDQAVAKRQEIGDKSFRMQGNVIRGTEHRHQGGMTFDLTYGGKVVTVDYTGEPSELFGPAIPVVLEGHFVGNDSFSSNSMLIRHDNNYDQKNPTRVKQAEKDAEKQS
jgi:cytochrome c-type biogenesis protein CcmE